jgi:HK97 gp10 family phage protein
MPFAIRAEVTGLRQVFKRLRQVDEKVRKKILRSALTAGGQIVLQEARAKVPVDSGLVKESLGKKVKVYRQSGTVVVIVGPRTGFRRMVKRRGRQKLVLENPTAIAHLAGPGRHQTFMAQAAESTRERVKSVVTQKILDGIEKA